MTRDVTPAKAGVQHRTLRTTMANQRIAFIPGDGIGIEVTAEAIKVLETLIQTRKLPIEHVVFDWGAEKYLREGVSLPEGALDMLRREFHAIFIGALGDPRVP